ncbi:MAG: hypothetical protein IPF92_06065 [Myxococcales bacterium]|nr:hypothetical protein [Myxococcales bacterium]MBL0192612.1 hypothetical protein [Myxococcales bacterium]
MIAGGAPPGPGPGPGPGADGGVDPTTDGGVPGLPGLPGLPGGGAGGTDPGASGGGSSDEGGCAVAPTSNREAGGRLCALAGVMGLAVAVARRARRRLF